MLLTGAALVMAACPTGGDDIVIGVVSPSTGPQAGLGRQIRNGAILAAESLNRRGGFEGRKVRIAYRDSADPSRLTGLLSDLARRDKPLAVVGLQSISAVRTKNNPLARAGIPTLTIGAAAGSIRENPHLFRLTPSNDDMVDVLADWLVGVRSIKKIAIASSSDEAGRDGAREFTLALNKLGAQLTTQVSISGDTTDLSPQVQAMRASGAEAVVVWATAEDAARVALAVRQIGWDVQIAGPNTLFETEFRSLAGAATDNTVTIVPKIKPEQWFSKELRDWFVEYHRRFTLLPIPEQRTLVADLPLSAITSYDAVNLVLDAARRVSSDEPAKISAALKRTDFFKGVIRSYAFRGREALVASDLEPGRFFNLALLSDISPGFDPERQIAFYKIQVSAYYVPDEYLDTKEGEALVERVLEDVLTNPEKVEFFRAYEPPRNPPGRI